MAGIAPGLDGYIAAQQMAQRQQQAETGALMQMLQLRNQMEQAAAQREMRPLQLEALRSQIGERNAKVQQAQQQAAAQGALSRLVAGGGYQGETVAPTAVAGSDAEALRMVQEAEAKGIPLGVNVPNQQNVRALTAQAFPDAYGKAQAAALFPKPAAPETARQTHIPVTGGYLSPDANGRMVFNRTQQDKPVADKPLENVKPVAGGYLEKKPDGTIAFVPTKSDQPKAPTGYRWNDAGNLEKIPGGPKDDTDRIEAAAEIAKEKAKVVIDKVDQALGKVGFFTTGLIGDIRTTLPGRVTGSGAYDLAKTLDTIKANIGFNELQAMRMASPTGGALGQVAVQELNMLQAVLSSLDQGQSADVLRDGLNRVKAHYTNWKAAVDKANSGNVQSVPSQPTAPSGAWSDDKERRYQELLRKRGG